MYVYRVRVSGVQRVCGEYTSCVCVCVYRSCVLCVCIEAVCCVCVYVVCVVCAQASGSGVVSVAGVTCCVSIISSSIYVTVEELSWLSCIECSRETFAKWSMFECVTVSERSCGLM